MDQETASSRKRPRRTYRACWTCRQRKLKCSFGDPNNPWDGPCERCTRERKNCIQDPPTEVNVNRSTMKRRPTAGSSTLSGKQFPTSDSPAMLDHSPSTSILRDASPGQDGNSDANSQAGDGELENENENDALVGINLQNPSDAMKLLATASSMRYARPGLTLTRIGEIKTSNNTNSSVAWQGWEPVAEGHIGVAEAAGLLAFFQTTMSPLYPLIHPNIFESRYQETLIHDESLLLGAIIAIAARYSTILVNGRGVSLNVSKWVQGQISLVMDGESSLRSISTVEALLLLSEWPMSPKAGKDSREVSEEAQLLRPCLRYDAYSWTYIGLAVRLGQELGLQELSEPVAKKKVAMDFHKMRSLKTWAYCYNADRHISFRLGRNAVLQQHMPTQWWATIAEMLGPRNDSEPAEEPYTSDVILLSTITHLLSMIQEHLYPSQEVTRALLRSGAWETFLRSLRLEVRCTKRDHATRLQKQNVTGAILQIELAYAVLSANALALRALQDRLKRHRQLNLRIFQSPSLLTLVEGPWVLEALSAARLILDTTLSVLVRRGILRQAPSRIFLHILFAATFLYKALATGVVEHGQNATIQLLDGVVQELRNAAIDDKHFVRGFAELLSRLGKLWREKPRPPVISPPAINVNRNQIPSIANQTIETQPFSFSSQANNISQTFFTNGSGMDASGISNQFSLQPQGTLSVSPSQPLAMSNPETDLDWLQNLEMDWQFRPSATDTAPDPEQEALFQTIWDITQPASSNSITNLYGTLLGDSFNVFNGT